MDLHFFLTLFKISAGLTGTFFLCREVYIGHQAELGRKLIDGVELALKRIAMLREGLDKEFLISTNMETFDMDQWKAASYVEGLPKDMIDKIIEDGEARKKWNEAKSKGLKMKKDLFVKFVEKSLALRRFYLTLGFALVTISGLAEVFDVLKEAHFIHI